MLRKFLQPHRLSSKSSSVFALGQKFTFHSSTLTRNDNQPSNNTNSNNKEEDEIALKLIQNVPGKDKTFNLLIGTLSVSALLSKEVIPYTPDVVYMFPFGVTSYLAFKYGGDYLHDILNKVTQERDKFWNDSKVKAQDHLSAEIEKITGSGITELVQVTEDLFDHAEDLVKMEAAAYEHEQKVAFYTKAKQILDEWVRYETNERERQQKLIAEEVMAKVMAAVEDASFQQKYMEQCLTDISTSLSR